MTEESPSRSSRHARRPLAISSTDRIHMRRAIDAAKSSVSKPDRNRDPNVGAVFVVGDTEVASAFRGETKAGDHAEFELFKKVASARGVNVDDLDVSGGTIFTTLEPCTRRKSKDKVPCAERIVRANAAQVFIGMYDPNPEVYRLGWRQLRDAGIQLRDFGMAERDEIFADNSTFTELYRIGYGDEGSAVFLPHLTGGVFEIRTESTGVFTPRLELGGRSVDLYANRGEVAQARYARSFAEVDDPGSLPWVSYTERIGPSGVGAFLSDRGYLLIRPTMIADMRYGGEYDAIGFEWEARPFED